MRVLHFSHLRIITTASLLILKPLFAPAEVFSAPIIHQNYRRNYTPKVTKAKTPSLLLTSTPPTFSTFA